MRREHRVQHQPSPGRRIRRSLLTQIRREAGLHRVRRDNARLNLRFSPWEWIQLTALILLMVLAMAIGAYLVQNFEGVVLND